jgi:multiple sugar transport system permease protein
MAIASERGVEAPGLWAAAGSRRLLPYLLLAPAVVAIAVVVVYPLSYTVYLSLFDYNLLRPAQGRIFVGLRNYATLVGNPSFWQSLRATLTYTAGTVAASFALGLGTALLLNASFPARGLARALIILPWTIPWLVTTLIWYAMLNPQFGPLNAVLTKAGVIRQGIPWLYQTSTAMLSIIAVTAWRLFPKVTLFLLAGLQTIPKERYEAAAIDGAGELAKFLHVTMPGLRAVNYVVIMLLTISSFKLFTVAWVLTGGGPGQATRLLSILTFEESLRFYRVGTGSTVATMMLLASALLVLAYYAALRRGGDQT